MGFSIGNWVRRRTGKWHVVESIIAGDAITNCGRRLSDERGLEVSTLMPLTRMIGQPQLCRTCHREPQETDLQRVGWRLSPDDLAAVEDDPNVAQVDPVA